jgi:hypothetical protein
MTGLVAVAFGVGAVALVALAWAVLGLRSRVADLSRQLDATVPAAPPSTATRVRSMSGTAEDDAASRLEISATAVPRPEPDAPPVALITAMAPGSAEEPGPRVSRVVSVTFAGPLIKAAALSHGLQHALREESRMRIGYAVRRELKRQRKLRRRRAFGGAAARGPVRDAAQGGRS